MDFLGAESSIRQPYCYSFWFPKPLDQYKILVYNFALILLVCPKLSHFPGLLRTLLKWQYFKNFMLEVKNKKGVMLSKSVMLLVEKTSKIAFAV